LTWALTVAKAFSCADAMQCNAIHAPTGRKKQNLVEGGRSLCLYQVPIRRLVHGSNTYYTTCNNDIHPWATGKAGDQVVGRPLLGQEPGRRRSAVGAVVVAGVWW
jgi:hypothetical protein